MLLLANEERNFATWGDVKHIPDGEIMELSDEEIGYVHGAWFPIFVAGVSLGFAIGSRIWR